MAACPDEPLRRLRLPRRRGGDARRARLPLPPAACSPRKARALAGRHPAAATRTVSFDRAAGDRACRPARRRARCAPTPRHSTRQLDEGRGLWFMGDVGTGKTTLAMLVSRAALRGGALAWRSTRCRGCSAMLRATYDDGSERSLSSLLDRLVGVDLLHIDDVGAEQTTVGARAALHDRQRAATRTGARSCITTNLTTRTRSREQIGRAHGVAA